MEQIHRSTADSVIVGGDFNSVVFDSKPYQMLEEIKMINAGKRVLTTVLPHIRPMGIIILIVFYSKVTVCEP